MKKILLVLLAAFLLAACSDQPKEEVTAEKPKEEVKAKEEVKNEKTEENGYYHDDYLGDLQVIGVGYSDVVGIDGTDAPIKPIKSGPIELYINNVSIVKINTTEESKIELDNQDVAYAAMIDVKVKNTSKQDVAFYPNQAIITTNVGEQVEETLLFTGDVGGDFLGKVEKEGIVWMPIKKDPEKIKSLTFIVNAPYDDGMNDLGKQIRVKFDVLDYQAAKEKDEK